MSLIRQQLEPNSVHALRNKATIGFLGRNDACDELMLLALTDNLLAVLDYAKVHEKTGHIWNALTLHARFLLQVSLKEAGRTFNHLVLTETEIEVERLNALKYIQDISKNSKYKKYAEDLLYLIEVKLPALHTHTELNADKKRYAKYINEFLLAGLYENSKTDDSYLRCMNALYDAFDDGTNLRYSYISSIQENLFSELKLPARKLETAAPILSATTPLLYNHTHSESYTKPAARIKFPRCAL